MRSHWTDALLSYACSVCAHRGAVEGAVLAAAEEQVHFAEHGQGGRLAHIVLVASQRGIDDLSRAHAINVDGNGVSWRDCVRKRDRAVADVG